MKGRRIASVLTGVLIGGALVAPAAHAADPTDITITGGSLSITADPTVPNFPGVTLDGTAKTSAATMTVFEVNDARGTGAGWNVTVQASQFTAPAVADDPLTTANETQLERKLALNSLSMAAPTVAADGTTSAAPTMTAGPYNIDASSAVKIASAAADTGMGKYDFSTSAFTLSIPSNAYARTYTSNVTVSAVSGP